MGITPDENSIAQMAVDEGKINLQQCWGWKGVSEFVQLSNTWFDFSDYSIDVIFP